MCPEAIESSNTRRGKAKSIAEPDKFCPRAQTFSNWPLFMAAMPSSFFFRASTSLFKYSKRQRMCAVSTLNFSSSASATCKPCGSQTLFHKALPGQHWVSTPGWGEQEVWRRGGKARGWG